MLLLFVLPPPLLLKGVPLKGAPPLEGSGRLRMDLRLVGASSPPSVKSQLIWPFSLRLDWALEKKPRNKVPFFLTLPGKVNKQIVKDFVKFFYLLYC